jgi:hypothetical protein
MCSFFVLHNDMWKCCVSDHYLRVFFFVILSELYPIFIINWTTSIFIQNSMRYSSIHNFQSLTTSCHTQNSAPNKSVTDIGIEKPSVEFLATFIINCGIYLTQDVAAFAKPQVYLKGDNFAVFFFNFTDFYRNRRCTFK